MTPTDKPQELCPMMDESGNYKGAERRRVSSRQVGDWHLDKTVSITQIAALIGVVITGTMLFMTQDKRIEINGSGIQGNAKSIIAEVEGRKLGDRLVEERLNRHEVEQTRTTDRVFVQLDKIYDLLRKNSGGNE